ncbi:MAG: putative rane protein [Bacteroidetes bacterium]|nr:putative rane protein [Bacteroidota bacterium]
MLLVVAGTILHLRWLRGKNPLGTWNADVVSSIGVVIVVLLLDLVTGETKDYFEKSLFGMDSSDVEYSRLRNLQQLSLSGAWLLYSIILMIVGIWRRQRGIRIVSIVLFGFTILKIFIYDLSFLETLYRIFSFIGLGVILLAVSYLYQKYKDVILGVEKLSNDPTEPRAQV